MEEVLGRVDKVILDEQAGGSQGVVPFLPLNELGRGATGGSAIQGAQGTGSMTGGTN
jgi:membrane protease subunit HflK